MRSGDAGIITCADIRLPSSTSEMEKLWSTEPDDLVVPLGLKADGSVISVNLRTDGPHALVAGTTGAGKSELLRTWIASLGARYSPSRVNLLLIDYKGGAAFGELSSLPHCVGLVTDLSAGLADRALVSLRSELKRREVCLSRHRASSLADVPLPERPATLVLVADEFATLASEVPTFLDGVLDIAQRGRSLGIHLILATQRPAGVISDAIRANTSLRIAMRLPDSDDSLDVIDDPSASLLTRDSPGAAIMRFGHEELVLAQIAYSGSVPKSQPSMEVRILGSEETRSRTIPPLVEPEQGAAPKTELETLVANAIAVNANLELPAAHRPWVDALPEQVEYGDVAELSGGDGLAIGVADIVRQQRIDALTVDFSTKGGLAICGGPGSGRSNTLAAVAAAAERRGDYRIHAIDCRAASANGHTSTLRGNRAIDSYMSGLDHEAIHRLLRSTLEPARDRPGKTLLLIDGFAEFCEQQEGINAAVAIDMVSRIAAHSRSNGVDIAITVARRSDLPHQLAHLLGNRLIHRCIEPDEPVNWDAPSLLCDPEIPDGRVWNGSVWAQVMIVAGDPDCALPQAYALPKFLAPSNEPTRRDPPSEDQWELRIGLDLDTLEQTCLDLDRCNALVLGPPRSGRSSTLETIRGAAHNRGIEVFQTDDNPTEMIDTILREAPHAPTLVLLDDLDDWIEDPAVDASLSQLAGFSRRSPLRIVAAGDGTRLQRCFADSMMQLRNARNSVLLGKHAHDLGSVVDTDVRRRDDLTWRQGRAVSVSNGSVAAIQVFFENREL